MPFLALALAAQTQAGTDDGVILSVSSETAFTLPLSTLRRSDDIAFGTLVQIFPDVGEPWEEVRRDAVVEIDCATASWWAEAEKQIAYMTGDVPLSFHPAATRVLGLVTPRSVG